MDEYKTRIDGFLRIFWVAGMCCKSLACDIISSSASFASPKAQPCFNSFLSSCTNRSILRLCCCTVPGCTALPELAATGSERSRTLAANNSELRHRSCLFKAGCSTLSQVVPAARFFCLLAALGFACGRCSSASICSSAALTSALFLWRSLSSASHGISSKSTLSAVSMGAGCPTVLATDCSVLTDNSSCSFCAAFMTLPWNSWSTSPSFFFCCLSNMWHHFVTYPRNLGKSNCLFLVVHFGTSDRGERPRYHI